MTFKNCWLGYGVAHGQTQHAGPHAGGQGDIQKRVFGKWKKKTKVKSGVTHYESIGGAWMI